MIALPKSWSDWEITDLIGEGSFAAVYRARRRDDPSFESAVKVIPIPRDEAEAEELTGQGFTRDQSRRFFDETVEEFIREVRIMEQFKGTQNIVSIEDYKAEPKESGVGSNLFIRMELLVPLDRYLSGREVTERDAAQLGADVCSALSLCMSRGLIHRDVKPENIFVNDRIDGHVFYKLGDFGIARTMEQRTGGMSARGTPNYIAPEAALGKPYDTRADIYSLGLTMYRLLNNNRLPFFPRTALYTPAAKREALMRRLNGETPEPPANASPEMAKVILKACSFRPEDRYQTADEMKEAIRAAMDSPAESAEAPAPAEAPEPPVKERKTRFRTPAVLLAAALVLALGIGGLTLLWSQWTDDGESSGGLQDSQSTVTAEPAALRTQKPQKTEGPTSDTEDRYDPLAGNEECRSYFEKLRQRLSREDGAAVVYVPFDLAEPELEKLPELLIPELRGEKRLSYEEHGSNTATVAILEGTTGWTLNGKPMGASKYLLKNVSSLPRRGAGKELRLEQYGDDYSVSFVYACVPGGECKCCLAELTLWPDGPAEITFRYDYSAAAVKTDIKTSIFDAGPEEEPLVCTATYLDGLTESYLIKYGEDTWCFTINDSFISHNGPRERTVILWDAVYRLRSPVEPLSAQLSLPEDNIYIINQDDLQSLQFHPETESEQTEELQ